MNPTDYEYLSNFLRATSGLWLGENKGYLLEDRLEPLAQSWGLDGIPQFVQELKKKADDNRLSGAVTEAMTTNETLFFRDKDPFEELKEWLLPEIISNRATSRRLKIWCTAASTGQEPYSIAMLLLEHFPELKDWNVEILATDISSAALARAGSGIYSQFEIQRGLPVQLLMKYFAQCDTGWQIHEDLRQQIRWQEMNMLNNFSNCGRFDIIFCRNILIYFEIETKKTSSIESTPNCFPTDTCCCRNRSGHHQLVRTVYAVQHRHLQADMRCHGLATC